MKPPHCRWLYLSFSFESGKGGESGSGSPKAPCWAQYLAIRKLQFFLPASPFSSYQENHSARDKVWLGVTLQEESGASQPLEGRCHGIPPPASAPALFLAQGSVPRALSITGKWLTIRSLNIHNTSQYSNDYPKNKVPLATLSCNRINKKMKTKTRAAPGCPS